jgi:RimJ/RimL family protein N-acetyltransferase
MFDKTIIQRAPKHLKTERLHLKAPDAEFAEALADSIAHSAQDYFFMPSWRAASDLDVAHDELVKSAQFGERGESLVWFAFEEHSDKLVGRLDLHGWDFVVPCCEIGCLADSRMTGRGLMREAALAIMDWAYAQGVVRIEAVTDVRNERAIRFAQALGMQQEGVLRSADRDALGELCDLVMLARVRM